MTDTAVTDYVNASEAARILGVSRQRVAAMVHNDEIEHVRPWPRQVLISRAVLDAWMHGHRPAPIHKTACRNWILAQEGVTSIDAIHAARVVQLAGEFIAEHRPDWDTTNKERWVEGMTGLLLSHGGAPR